MASALSEKSIVLGVFLALLLKSAHAIDCYQCLGTDSEHPFQCNEFLSSDIDIKPEPCDNVYGAQYCVKHIGRFEVSSLDCYQCSSADNWTCMNGDLIQEAVELRNCSHVFGASYCIKTVGKFGGGIGTKRYCSSVDWGNYCNYVRQPGDKLMYRTCVFTCSGNGCNPATTTLPSLITLVIPALMIGYVIGFKR